VTVPARDQPPWPGWTGALRCLLTLAAGAANAFGFFALGGVFTSVVTANSALLGLRNAHLAAARLVAVALLGYVVGAVVGGLVAAGRGRLRGTGIRGGLLLEALLLWLVVGGWLYWYMAPHGAARALLLFLMAAAMGCQNGSVRVTAGSEMTTAYLTGLFTATITAFAIEGRLQARSLVVVASLIAGAVVDGAVCRWLRPAAPFVPALLVTVALAATWVPTRSRPAAVALHP
jgi:uncharacterized membrane protein YoaK (UPF0700 family)